MTILFQTLYRFFNNMTEPLNEAEVTQPAPLDQQREHLLNELNRVNLEIVKRREFLEKLDESK